MTNCEDGQGDRELEREIRQERKFTPQEALARLAGPGAMKGASAISCQQQAENEIGCWLRDHVPDPTGALQVILRRQLHGSELLLNHVTRPTEALARFCERLLASDQLLKEFVREADAEWGRMMDERPHFERAGSPQNPNDPYTVNSVRRTLGEILNLIAG